MRGLSQVPQRVFSCAMLFRQFFMKRARRVIRCVAAKIVFGVEKRERPERWLNVILGSTALGETMFDNPFFDFEKLSRGVFRWQSFR